MNIFLERTRISDANGSGVVLSCGMIHWALIRVPPMNSGWWREFNAPDVVRRRLWSGSTADRGLVLLRADGYGR